MRRWRKSQVTPAEKTTRPSKGTTTILGDEALLQEAADASDIFKPLVVLPEHISGKFKVLLEETRRSAHAPKSLSGLEVLVPGEANDQAGAIIGSPNCAVFRHCEANG